MVHPWGSRRRCSGRWGRTRGVRVSLDRAGFGGIRSLIFQMEDSPPEALLH